MMNEETEQFEQRLSRQQLKEIPRQWRREILFATSKVGTARRAVRLFGRAGRVSLPSWLKEVFWPSPAAWAGLAVVWILIFAVDFSARDKSPVVAEKLSRPSLEVIVELRQQQRLLAELIGPSETRDADRTKSFVPQPRSERCFEILTT